MGRILGLETRKEIKQMLDQGLSVAEIADACGVHRATIYNELDRGRKRRYDDYDPVLAQERHLVSKSKKGRPPSLPLDAGLCQRIADLILSERMSPQAALKQIRKEGQFKKIPSTVNTIYAAIDRGYIPGVTKETLRRNIPSKISKNAVQIPVWIRKRLGLQNGDIVQCEIVNDRDILLRVCARDEAPGRESDETVGRTCGTCEFNTGAACGGSGRRTDTGENTYGMPIEEAARMFPHGCSDWGISLDAYIAQEIAREKEAK